MSNALMDITSKIDSESIGEVSMTKSEKDAVAFTKYESQNPMISDTQHHGAWHIQVTSDQMLGDKLGLREDDGVIIDFEGTPRGEVAISSLGEELTESQATLREDTTGQNLPRFIAFDFRVKKLTKTDGPQQRELLMKSIDQRRQDSESTLIETLTKAFQGASGQLAEQGNINPSKSELMDAVKKSSKEK
tara:strand:- start:530 stop:1099 length:570 start_codon:yes stop_codon:yes gene_type:complete